MINQRLYPDKKLGNATQGQTIASHGCYLCSLDQGLRDRGYQFDPVELNRLFIDLGVFAPGSASLASSVIATKVPEIFLEGRNEAWNDANLLKYLADKSYIVLGEVDARGIGGSGQHFVYIERVDTSGGKITMSYIGDPWGGLDQQKVTTRYNAYGNILSFRVFKVKQGVPMGTITVQQSDWDRLLKASRLGDRLIQGLGVSGNIADKDDSQIDLLIAKWKQIETDKNNAQADVKAKQVELDKVPQQLADAKAAGFTEGKAAGLAECPTVPTPPPLEDPNPDSSKFSLDGVGVIVDQQSKQVVAKQFNYKLK